MQTLIIASQNQHKIEEIQAITAPFGFDVLSRDKAGIPPIEIVEDGETFEENAYKKAHEIMKLCGKATIADDSGLEVDALGGAPGVLSARFAGDEHVSATDKENNQKLISLLSKVPYLKRTGKFVSVIALLFPNGQSIIARGEVKGHLLLEERGENGFGYDPLFVPLGHTRTFGELTGEEKNKLSHRANALKSLKRQLEKRLT